MEQKYFGPWKVLGIERSDVTTPSGSEVVNVVFEGRKPELVPKKAFDLLASEEPVGLDLFYKAKHEIMVPEIIKLIAEYDVKQSEISLLIKKVADSMFDSCERAVSFLWTGDDAEWIKGFSPTNDRTLTEIQKVLKTIPVQNGEGKSA